MISLPAFLLLSAGLLVLALVVVAAIWARTPHEADAAPRSSHAPRKPSALTPAQHGGTASLRHSPAPNDGLSGPDLLLASVVVAAIHDAPGSDSAPCDCAPTDGAPCDSSTSCDC